MLGIIHIDYLNNLIILLFNWKVGAQEGHQLAYMLQAKEMDHKEEEALKEWIIFQELEPA
jgi:hypothetical protein